ncbi:MAG: quinohemoprotein ethanol dehydrogenase [Gammaproteobacteria bacterium]|jgi:quinohemoprotein ethanol dehydrogenase
MIKNKICGSYSLLFFFMLWAFFISGAHAESNALSGKNWPSYGGADHEHHASPLKQIDSSNITRLGLAWALELPDIDSGATIPIAVDGVIYFAIDQAIVHAVDAESGRLLWRYDPKVSEHAGEKLRFTYGSRGLAYWQEKLYVGTVDGRLLAIDANSGLLLWSQLTVELDDALGISGAPRVFNGKVIIGNGGADYGAVRGYVTTYDAETGEQLWRFYTVPGNPADGFENEAMAMAAKTWTGEWWKFGGGGTAWNAITYDGEFNRVYIGTGNGGPWNRKIRSPGGGDNLFLSSIVALDADTGEYVWHYQTVPGETWDYNSAMDITLADLVIDGKPHKVLMHAPKNGFFYVIDREIGQLLSADKFEKVTWAEKIDLETGRPVESADARFPDGEVLMWPGGIGGHNWHPMSYNRLTGLVYIPTMNLPGYFNDKGIDHKQWKHQKGTLNAGVNIATQDGTIDVASSALIAWDPVNKREVWRVATPGMWNGGTMTTAGNLVFQGDADGYFKAYAANNGEELWSVYARMGITGAPISFESGGKQYITVIAGWGAAGPAFLGTIAAQHGWVAKVHKHRVLTFVLDGLARVPDNPAPLQVTFVDDSEFLVDESRAQHGEQAYATRCIQCHGVAAVAGGFAPDLRASPITLSADAFKSVLRDGVLEAQGMPPFAELSDGDLSDLRHYLIRRARESLGIIGEE